MAASPVADSPVLKARLAGFFYLMVFLTGGAALFASKGILVPGDAAATATNLLAQEARFWVSFTFNQIVIACYVAVTALFYELFKPVKRSVSLLAAFFSLTGCAVQACALLFYGAPLVVLKNAQFSNLFTPDQTHALAFLFLKLYAPIYDIGLVFFGFYCMLIGYLIFRSLFIPRVLGVLMMLGGLSWLSFISPPLADSLRPYNLAPGVVGEGSLTVWLLLVGVNVRKWVEQAGAR